MDLAPSQSVRAVPVLSGPPSTAGFGSMGSDDAGAMSDDDDEEDDEEEEDEEDGGEEVQNKGSRGARICVHTVTSSCLYIYMNGCMYICMNGCMQVYMYEWMYV